MWKSDHDGNSYYELTRPWSSGLDQEHSRFVAELRDGESVDGSLYRTKNQGYRMVPETNGSRVIGSKTEPERSMPASWPEEPQGVPSLEKQFSEKLLDSILTLFLPSETDSE